MGKSFITSYINDSIKKWNTDICELCRALLVAGVDNYSLFNVIYRFSHRGNKSTNTGNSAVYCFVFCKTLHSFFCSVYFFLLHLERKLIFCLNSSPAKSWSNFNVSQSRVILPALPRIHRALQRKRLVFLEYGLLNFTRKPLKNLVVLCQISHLNIQYELSRLLGWKLVNGNDTGWKLNTDIDYGFNTEYVSCRVRFWSLKQPNHTK